ncbi:MAG: hypothetical protein PHU12_03695 [Candidatus Aenigmarchaeota archaeon]|nr:hypothetical protein [Candidatus Aenigmarchaeota archaeon]
MKVKKNKKNIFASCPAIIAYRLGAMDKSTAIETRYLVPALGLSTEDLKAAVQYGLLKKYSPGGGGAIVIANNLETNKSEIFPMWKSREHIIAMLEENKKALSELDEKIKTHVGVKKEIQKATQEEISEILRRLLPIRQSVPVSVLKRLHILDERYVSNKYHTTEKFIAQSDQLSKETEAYLVDEHPNIAWKFKYVPPVLKLIKKWRLSTSAAVLASFSNRIDKLLANTTKEREQLGKDLFTEMEKMVKTIKSQGKNSFSDVNVTELVEKL